MKIWLMDLKMQLNMLLKRGELMSAKDNCKGKNMNLQRSYSNVYKGEWLWQE